jgi:hypothetical protein
MQIYKMIRQDRVTNRETPICRFKAEDYDEAIKIAERIEVFPGIFGDDSIDPNRPMILMFKDADR